MSPRDALNLFDQVAANFNGNRQDHVNLQSAIAALNGLVLKAEAETKVATTAKKDVPQAPEK